MRILSNPLDALGFSASFLCALHCISLPLIATFGMSGALPWLESEVLEMALIVSTLVIAGWSLVSTFRRHGDRRPLWYAGLGFVVIIGGHLAQLSIEHYLAGVGGIAIAYAHYLNWTLIGQCSTRTAFSLGLKARAKRRAA
jgi:hypothetical protein